MLRDRTPVDDPHPSERLEDPVAGDLPAELTPLIGRRRELAELETLLVDTRLLTLTGPGGCGKSRLALAVAAASRDDHPGGVWWVDLAAVADPSVLHQHVAAGVGLTPPLAQPAHTAIARRLAAEPALLVLDNCERVVDAAAELIVALLGISPRLRIVASSRQPLAIAGEQLFRVEGLAVAAPEDPAGEDGAVELFLERAARAAPSLAVTADTTAAVTRLCRRLDGMPLAIELAAARVSVLSLDQIADRLEHDSRLLRHADHAAPERHWSLHAALEWSHRLLSPGEQVLFRRLAAFRGTFSLDGAETVGAAAGAERLDVLELLAGLIDHSLVQVVNGGGGDTRYRLLETVRQYAGEHLERSGEREAVFAAHAAWCLELAERAQCELASGDQAAWLACLQAEQDNLRAALARQSMDEPELVGRLVGVLWPFWSVDGSYQEARAWLERSVTVADRLAPAVRAGVLAGAGVLAFLQCDYPLATTRLEAALELRRELGDRPGEAGALQRLGSIAREQGRYAEAQVRHGEARAVWDELGDPLGVAVSEDYLAFAAWLVGDLERAETLGAAALEHFRGVGAEQATAAALVNLGASAGYAGDQARARERLEEALAISERVGYREGVAWARHELAIVARREHDLPRAAALLRLSLLLHVELGDRWRTASVLEELSGLLVRVEPVCAAELLGAAEALREALLAPVPPVEVADLEHVLTGLRERLSPSDLERHRAGGRAGGLEQAVQMADELARQLASPEAPRWRSAVSNLLTDREQVVLALLSEGRTNREIATELFISPSTAGVHVSNILRKLDVRSRVQAATLARGLGVGAEPPVSRESRW